MSVPVYALNLHNLATEYPHLPQPAGWRVDRFGVVGTLYPATDALGTDQVNAWAAEFGGAPVVVEADGREPGHASVDLPEWGVVITCVLLGKRAGTGR